MSPCLNKLTDEQNAWSFYGWESVKWQRQFISRMNLMQLARGDFNLAYKTEELARPSAISIPDRISVIVWL